MCKKTGGFEMDYFTLYKSFLNEYIDQYMWAFPARVVYRLKQRWFKQRSEYMGERRTTSIDLFEYDFDLLDSLEPSINVSSQSQKIRYAMRLGILAHHQGWDKNLPFAQEVIETMLDMAKGDFETWLVEDIEEYHKKTNEWLEDLKDSKGDERE
jgi:hypothetical protein